MSAETSASPGDYVKCRYLMLQNDSSDDYVIGTGGSHSVREFCEIAFRRAGLDWQDHVIFDDKLIRKIDSYHTTADSSKVRARLGWRPKTSFQELVVDQRIRLLSRQLSSSDSRRRIKGVYSLTRSHNLIDASWMNAR